MKRIFSSLIALLLLSGMAMSQVKLKKVMTLDVPGDGGSNGASIVFNPVNKRYYAPMAGNAAFQMGIYSATGKLLSTEEDATVVDVRGIWFNPATKTMQVNCYNDGGWVEYKLNSRGMIGDTKTLFEGMKQPSDQSVASFDPKAKSVIFLDGSNVVYYSLASGEATDKMVELHPGIKQGQKVSDDEILPEFSDNYNTTTVLYIGTPAAEFGLLNVEERQIELYNKKGYMVKKMPLPDDAPCASSFNFGYANGIYWLFDKDERKWYGYK